MFEDYRGTMNRLNGLIARGLVPLAYDEEDLATPWLNRARGSTTVITRISSPSGRGSRSSRSFSRVAFMKKAVE